MKRGCDSCGKETDLVYTDYLYLWHGGKRHEEEKGEPRKELVGTYQHCRECQIVWIHATNLTHRKIKKLLDGTLPKNYKQKVKDKLFKKTRTNNEDRN